MNFYQIIMTRSQNYLMEGAIKLNKHKRKSQHAKLNKLVFIYYYRKKHYQYNLKNNYERNKKNKSVIRKIITVG